MRPTIAELHDESKFILIESFHIDDTMRFLTGQLNTARESDRKTNKLIGRVFSFGFFLVCVFIGYKIGTSIVKGSIDKITVNQGIQSLYGILAMFFIILPIHELIHGLTFKYFKAPKVGYGVSIKAGMVYAYAQKFPISMPELRVLAMMPFLVLTTILCISLGFFPQYQAFIITILIIHTMACVGDFALTRYSIIHKNKEIYSYDDLEVEKKTYFFERI
jgi:Putative zincin peptidase